MLPLLWPLSAAEEYRIRVNRPGKQTVVTAASDANMTPAIARVATDAYPFDDEGLR